MLSLITGIAIQIQAEIRVSASSISYQNGGTKWVRSGIAIQPVVRIPGARSFLLRYRQGDDAVSRVIEVVSESGRTVWKKQLEDWGYLPHVVASDRYVIYLEPAAPTTKLGGSFEKRASELVSVRRAAMTISAVDLATGKRLWNGPELSVGIPIAIDKSGNFWSARLTNPRSAYRNRKTHMRLDERRARDHKLLRSWSTPYSQEDFMYSGWSSTENDREVAIQTQTSRVATRGQIVHIVIAKRSHTPRFARTTGSYERAISSSELEIEGLEHFQSLNMLGEIGPTLKSPFGETIPIFESSILYCLADIRDDCGIHRPWLYRVSPDVTGTAYVDLPRLDQAGMKPVTTNVNSDNRSNRFFYVRVDKITKISARRVLVAVSLLRDHGEVLGEAYGKLYLNIEQGEWVVSKKDSVIVGAPD